MSAKRNELNSLSNISRPKIAGFGTHVRAPLKSAITHHYSSEERKEHLSTRNTALIFAISLRYTKEMRPHQKRRVG